MMSQNKPLLRKSIHLKKKSQSIPPVKERDGAMFSVLKKGGAHQFSTLTELISGHHKNNSYPLSSALVLPFNTKWKLIITRAPYLNFS